MNSSSRTDWINMCRTCLIKNSDMKPLYSSEHVFENKVLLSDMLMSCASIMVIHGDGLPENICIRCFEQVHSAFLFRKLCEKSDITLKECLNNYSLQNDALDSVKKSDSEFLQGEINEHVRSDNYYLDEQNSIDEADFDNSSIELENEYKCKKCDKIFYNLESLQNHTAQVHSEIFVCEQCGKTFISKNILSRHILRKHQGNKPKKKETVKKRNLPRTCDVCKKTFRFHSNLERHKLIHTGEKPYLCNVCGKGFAQISYLKLHSFTHSGEKPYKCETCGRSFAAPGTLMTHMRIHTGERPHVCKICGKNFTQSGYLSAHIRTHTGEKPTECTVCNRRFSQSSRLVVHMRIHSGEKPYKCKECGRGFAVKGTLKKHMRTHTGERPYICKICGQAFAQSGTLATHSKIHKQKIVDDGL